MQLIQEATFGAGCFWCVEACFSELKGVLEVSPGYAGGSKENPTYQEVCSGSTGHAEVVRVVFDAEKVSYAKLLEVFFFVHDPTQLNRQGNDIGTQYRSVVYFHSEQQKTQVEQLISKLEKEGVWENPIVTEVSPLSNFFVAEEYHRNYLELHPENAYCQAVVRPKYEKFKRVFASELG